MFGRGWKFAVMALLLATVATPALCQGLNRRADPEICSGWPLRAAPNANLGAFPVGHAIFDHDRLTAKARRSPW